MKRKQKINGIYFKWATVVVLILLDFLFFPSLLKGIANVLKHKGEGIGFGFSMNTLSPIHTLKEILSDPLLSKVLAILQVPLLMLMVSIFWKTDYERKTIKIDGIGGPPAAGAGQFGTARWLNEREVDQNYTVWPLKKPLLKGGTVLGMDPDQGKAWLDTEDTHKLIIGTTRSGKTRTVVYPSIYAIAQAGESMILTDPKGELYDRTSLYLEEQGYNVVVLNFLNPGHGNRWNPMSLVVEALQQGDQTAAAEAAWNAAHLLAHQKDSKGDSIWVDGSESVIAALIFAIATEADSEDQKHMTSVYKTLIELGEVQKVKVANQVMDYVPLNEFFKHLPTDHPARDAYGTARLSPEKMRGSFFGSVSVMLRLFADPGVAYLTAAQDHDLSAPGSEKTAVFLIIPDENTTRHPLAALYVAQTYQELVKLSRKHRNRLPVRVHMLLDEFGNMPQFNDFVTKLTVSGGRGILWNIVVQGINQIKKTYGADDMGTILGNCHTWIYILTTDSTTAKEISFKLGTYTVESETLSSNRNDRSSGTGASRGLMKRELLTPDEVLRWPVETSLVIRARKNPAMLSCPDITKWPADALFEWRVDNQNRSVPKVPIFIPGSSAVEMEPDEAMDDY
ncbi:hypothetical protein BSK66_27765 [Paenibacillus odorifer]|uniref:VirD4-like conjugal transfer protein, CD1115 family n=1 Tax=Paenibacillus TaxID=44249 RepID=UPI0003E1DD6B|nr:MULTISPECIES: type IV secretory system conjugative DNA transfer family protein [Paenibacillus]ETT61279.1 conjugation protein [Paenibacillus sp. FSL H8-237]OMD13755.1 hypothetical protein BJP47_24315 [Paenibacillus odorifer]OME48985.1 hypothetical protein BSK66_27765 [Paenibacillus odorifer]